MKHAKIIPIGGLGGFHGYMKVFVFENGSDTSLCTDQFFLWVIAYLTN